jgi:hypothetical protein
MAHVGVVVNGGATGVPGDYVGVHRHKFIFLIREGVKNSEFGGFFGS